MSATPKTDALQYDAYDGFEGNRPHMVVEPDEMRKLESELITTQKECAAMREALEKADTELQYWLEHAREDGEGQDSPRMPVAARATLVALKRIRASLTTNAGKGFVRREPLKQCRDALEKTTSEFEFALRILAESSGASKDISRKLASDNSTVKESKEYLKAATAELEVEG